MLSIIAGFMALGMAQDLEPQSSRPVLECASSLTNPSDRASCLSRLFDASVDALNAAQAAARIEAAESDMDSGGRFHAADSLDAAQSAWSSYRDAECLRRGALMFVSQASRDEIVMDCRISLTRTRTAELANN
jgi:uncharacterized protein YecT (DUF1311 family)